MAGKEKVKHPTELRPKIEIGYRIGDLIVEAPTAERKSGYIIWKCHCDCGGTILLDTRCLQRGTIRDCGCKTVVKPGQHDITGQRFGKLIALYPTGAKGRGGSLIWHCRCDCGGEVDAPLHQLTAGYRKSCGCLSHPPLKNFIGKRFGMLKVVEYAGKRDGLHRWKCRCDCGQDTVVGQTLLQSGKTSSCGCRQKTVCIDNLKLIDGTSVAILEALKKRKPANNSGVLGVYQERKSGKWIAQITFKGRKYHLGTFDNLEDAVKARKHGEKMHDDFLEWYYTIYCKEEGEH